MNLREVWQFEVRYQFTRVATWFYALALTGLPLLFVRDLGDGVRHVNATLSISATIAVVGLLGTLVTAALCGDAATRDIASGMHPLMYSAPLKKWEYLGGRFLGAITVNAVLLLAIPLGLLISLKVPYSNPVTFGPFQFAAYWQPMLLYAWPMMVFMAAILFTVAALARRTLPMYLTGIAVSIAYLYAANEVPSGYKTLATLLDPLGIIGTQFAVEFWTAHDQNVRLIGFPPILLLNRALWLLFSFGLLGLLYLRFHFALPRTRNPRRTAPARASDTRGASAGGALAVRFVERTFGRRTALLQTLVIARSALREILLSRLFLFIALGALLIVFTFGWEVGAIVFDTATWPVTHLVAGTVLSIPISFVFAALIGIYAGELVWRERDVRSHEITAAAPVPEWATMLGHFIALVGMIVVLQAVLMIAGMLLQALQGYYAFEPWLYLRILFGFTLADYILFAVLAMTVHVVVNAKFIGHGVVVLVFAFTVFAAVIGVRHHLLVYGTDPGWTYSDMNGFGPFVGPFVWFKLYWTGWALLLAVAARLLLVHGTENGFRARMRLARSRFTPRVAQAVGVAAILILTLGGFIFYNTNVLNEYRSLDELADLRAEYERHFKRYEDVPQPQLISSSLRVQIHPAEHAVDLHGTYSMRNLTTARIDSVHVLVHPDIQAQYLALDRPAQLVVGERQLYTYRIYALDKPLLPGDSLRLVFRTAYRPRGFRNHSIQTAVVANGAYFDRRWLPVIGYQPAFELDDKARRRERGLPARTEFARLGDADALQRRSDLRDADLVSVDAVIGTDEDQIAVTPGTLVREWRANGRRYFHYKTDAPISHGVPFLSAEYAVRKDKWNDVSLEILHHPTHTFNLDRMMHAMKASLEYFSTQFGPYQFRQLRIVEFPRYASFARAHPHTIAYSEGSAFITRINPGDVDRPFFVTAHEAAHQWWGHQVMGARVEGAALLSETLAQYGAMMVMEKTYGPQSVRAFYRFEMERYLRGRSNFADEQALLRVAEQPHVYYHKGAVAMYTLREHIGEERVNTALRRYLEKHRAGKPPFPTSLDLYAELQAVTPDSVRSLLTDLFEDITLWEVRADSAQVEPNGTGGYQVTLNVTASKVKADSAGKELETPMNDLIEIGVFPSGDGWLEKPLYLQKHRIRSGKQTISVTVPSEPARAGIDPHRKLIQRMVADNIVELKVVAPPRP